MDSVRAEIEILYCGIAEYMKGGLTEIIQLATLDPDPWVLMVADILKSFPDIGSLNLDLEEQNPNVQDILGELREKVSDCESSAMLPLECQYLNKNALTTLAGPFTPPVKHFQLKRKPKSATLRAELLQKSAETAQQLKKTAGVAFHAKGRGLVKKIDTTTPLKGIPKQAPFRNPTTPIVFSPTGNRTPILSSKVPLCKERGVKYLDIKELKAVDSGREAKRRRKTLDTDVVAKQAKEETVVENATPDYAAGLVSTQKLASLNNDPALASTSYLPAAPSAVPSSSYVPGSDPQPAGSIWDPLQAKDEAASAAPPAALPAAQFKQRTPIRSSCLQPMKSSRWQTKLQGPRRRSSSGSWRDPEEQGDVIQIKLSEHTEVMPNPDGTGSTTMLVDTIFEMNYATGEWSRLTKRKPMTNIS
ncbi:Negative elongation factor A, partial [Ophiophagus hannah]